MMTLVGPHSRGWVAGTGHEAVVRGCWLRERDGVDIDAKDNEGKTPFMWAAENGRLRMGVRLLYGC